MKIGVLSKRYKVSVDCLYYYIKIGLLVPRRKEKQYFIDETCERDLQLILTYKQWGFSLTEIHSILTHYRISSMQQPEDVMNIISTMQQKYEQFQAEIDELARKQQEIKEAKETLLRAVEKSSLDTSRSVIGVPLAMLDLLVCPKCGKALQFSNARMTRRYITDAEVSCPCGYEAEIRDGILLTPNKNTSKYDRPDLQREFYRDIPDELVSIYQQSYNWMDDKIHKIGPDGKIVLETHLNAYFFLQFHLHHLEKQNCKIILIDKFPEILMLYKDFLERNNIDIDILFIADNSTQWPLAHGNVDIFIDFFSSNEHQFYHQSNLIGEVKPFLSPVAHVVGTYFFFPSAQRSIQNLLQNYPEASRNNFNAPLFRTAMREAGFAKVESRMIGTTSNTGSNWCFGFMEQGEDISLCSFLAKKRNYPAGL